MEHDTSMVGFMPVHRSIMYDSHIGVYTVQRACLSIRLAKFAFHRTVSNTRPSSDGTAPERNYLAVTHASALRL